MILLLYACTASGTGAAPSPVAMLPGAGSEQPAPPPGLPSPDQRVPLAITPKNLYEGCRERVESPESPGECKVDADCAATGCNGEVCTRAGTDAGGGGALVTTCDRLPCFDVLDTCGCVAGACTWSLKLPTSFPPGGAIPRGEVVPPPAPPPAP